MFFNFTFITAASGDGWSNVILETEEELNFAKNAMSFFPAHDKFLLGGSTNQSLPSCSGSIEFSNYLSVNSGKGQANLVVRVTV